MKRLSDLVDIKPVPEYRSVDDVIGIDITVHNFAIRRGMWGDYVVLYCSDSADGQPFFVTCGAVTVVDAFRQLDRNRDQLPVVIRFVRKGRRITIE